MLPFDPPPAGVKTVLPPPRLPLALVLRPTIPPPTPPPDPSAGPNRIALIPPPSAAPMPPAAYSGWDPTAANPAPRIRTDEVAAEKTRHFREERPKKWGIQ